MKLLHYSWQSLYVQINIVVSKADDNLRDLTLRINEFMSHLERVNNVQVS